MNLNNVEYYYIRNAQGDISGLFDKTGTQVVSYTYDTWGKLLSTTGTLASTVGVKNPYLYRGYRYDSETGLYYLQSRYYNPDWGRFINADAEGGQVGALLSHNVFAYCMNNPVNMADPDGNWPTWNQFWTGVGIVVAAVVSALIVVACIPEEAAAVITVGVVSAARAVVSAGSAALSWIGTRAGPVTYNPTMAGPLPERISNTFRSGTYTQIVTKAETTLYRVWGGKVGQLGSYWTTSKPTGPLESVVSSALNQGWGNTATNVTQMIVPKGTTIFQGFAASQGGLVGGGIQIFIRKVDPSWIVK